MLPSIKYLRKHVLAINQICSLFIRVSSSYHKTIWVTILISDVCTFTLQSTTMATRRIAGKRVRVIECAIDLFIDHFNAPGSFTHMKTFMH